MIFAIRECGVVKATLDFQLYPGEHMRKPTNLIIGKEHSLQCKHFDVPQSL